MNMQVFVPEVLVKRLGGERLGGFVGVRKQVFELISVQLFAI